MLYPGYEPYLGRPPMIMHYGAAYTLGKAYFNKMEHQKLTLETCPGFLFADAAIGSVEQLTHPNPNPNPNLNPNPNPYPGNIEQLTKKDALSLEHLATMNAAFCGFYGNISLTLSLSLALTPTLTSTLTLTLSRQHLVPLDPRALRRRQGQAVPPGGATGQDSHREVCRRPRRVYLVGPRRRVQDQP